MNTNLLNVFHFTELEKILGFLLEVRYNSQITHIKTKGVVICDGTIVVTMCIVGNGYHNVWWPKDV